MKRNSILRLTALALSIIAGPSFGPPPLHSYQAGSFAIELEGVNAGYVKKVSGGEVSAEVVKETLGASATTFPKRLGNRVYEDIILDFGKGMSPEMQAFVKAALDSPTLKKSGVISYLDMNAKEVSRLEFSQALISEVTFPALDASSPQAVGLILKLKPAFSKRSAGTGRRILATGGERKLLSSAFRLSIDNLDCSRVSRVESITVRPGLGVADLVPTLSASEAQSFIDWHQTYVVDGGAASTNERQGTLEFLDSSLSSTILALDLKGLGIYRLKDASASADSIAKLRAEMYAESVSVR